MGFSEGPEERLHRNVSPGRRQNDGNMPEHVLERAPRERLDCLDKRVCTQIQVFVQNTVLHVLNTISQK